LRSCYGRTILPVRILQRDLSASKRKDIAPFHLHPTSICTGSREYPLGNATIALYKVASVTPVRVRKSSEYFDVASSDCLTTYIPCARDFGARRGFKHTVVRH